MRLKTDESFTGFALFEPDPEADDNPGYYEYYTHWDQQGNRFVPCAGEDCPFCAVNDAPSTRAITAWYMPDNNKGEQLKLFELNWRTIQTLDDESEDEGGILGRKIRIRRLDDRGNHTVKVRTGPENKPLSKAEQKRLLAEIEANFNFEEMTERRLRGEMERIRAVEALEDAEDDDVEEDEDEEQEESPRKRRTGKAKAEVEEDEDEAEDEEDEIDEDEEDEEVDEDEEEEEAEEDEEEPEEDEEDEDAESLQGTFTVVRANEEDEIFNLTDEDGEKFKMFVGEDVEPDYDSMKKGAEVVLSAVTDDEGDWIITEIKSKARPKVKAPARRSGTGTRTRRTTRK